MFQQAIARFKKFWHKDVVQDEEAMSTGKEVLDTSKEPHSRDLDAAFKAESHGRCENCEAPLYNEYCGVCGQRDLDLKRPVWSLLMELTDNYFAWDGKMIKTLAPLMFMPGYLTKSFFQGQRVRYLPPIRLYILSSILFFITVFLTDVAILKIEFVPKERPVAERQQDQEKAMDNGKAAIEQALQQRNLPDSVRQSLTDKLAEIERLEAERLEARNAENQSASTSGELSGQRVVSEDSDSRAVQMTVQAGDRERVITMDDTDWDVDISMFAPMEGDGDQFVPVGLFDNVIEELEQEKSELEDPSNVIFVDFAEDVVRGVNAAAERPERMNNALNDWITTALLILLPLFGFLLRLFYWGKDNALIKQMIFSLHFHTYVFLVLTALVLVERFFKVGLDEWMFYAAVPLYLFIALKVSSGNGWLKTIFKFSLVSFIYSIIFGLTVTLAVVMSFSEL